LILSAIGAAYGAVATWRRRWYARSPGRCRHLKRPVVSIGNIRIGGSGKTPAVAEIARLLAARGERPSILSRGYGRRRAPDGVTVVSDGSRVLAHVDTAGDEPLMLARALPGVPVLVCADRFLAGTLAEAQLGATVHLLDDGFQHVSLARDVDLVIADGDDLKDSVLPAGRLREPLANAHVADALLTVGDSEAVVTLRHALGVADVFGMRRFLGEPTLARTGEPLARAPGTPIVAVAGIARPHRFFDDLARDGWTVADTMAFRDHHWFTAADIERIVGAAARVDARYVLTTEKDLVRFERCDVTSLPLGVVPVKVSIEPPAFADWLINRLSRRDVWHTAAGTPYRASSHPS
jgi:tetraacyldisaccharide 4'-kinase